MLQQAQGCPCPFTMFLIVHVEQLAADMCLPRAGMRQVLVVIYISAQKFDFRENLEGCVTHAPFPFFPDQEVLVTRRDWMVMFFGWALEGKWRELGGSVPVLRRVENFLESHFSMDSEVRRLLVPPILT